jgi:hypothetical protein
MTETPAPTGKFAWNDLLDSVSKTTAVGLFLIYVFGFLIVSIHHADYGLNETSPFKPKILAAGILFVVFTVLPIIIANGIFFHRLEIEAEQNIARAVVAAFSYLIACNAFVSAFFWMFDNKAIQSIAKNSLTWFDWTVSISMAVGLPLAAWLIQFSWKRYLQHPGKIFLLNLAAIIVAVAILGYIGIRGKSVGPIVILWSFGFGIIGVVLQHAMTKPEQDRRHDWSSVALPLAAAVALFPGIVYGRLKSSWGGGSPVPVTVFLSKDSQILPNQHVSVELLDDTDAGIYFKLPKSNHGLFVPRSAIAAIYYSDEPLPQELVQPSQKLQ